MRQPLIILIGTILMVASTTLADPFSLDSNVAFYEGETLNYVIYPPDNFQMVEFEATVDGYSFAFVPNGQQYDTAEMVIGINLYKIRGLEFEQVLTEDTLALREHYGPEIALWSVDSIFTSTGQEVSAIYINDPSGFVSNVMLSYVNGVTELLVFELVITDRVARFVAEDRFVQCLNRLKVLTLGNLGYND